MAMNSPRIFLDVRGARCAGQAFAQQAHHLAVGTAALGRHPGTGSRSSKAPPRMTGLLADVLVAAVARRR